MADSLTLKQETFARNIIKGMSQSDAYRDAYDAENMAQETIHVKASELAKDGKVGARIECLRADQMKLLDYDLTAHLKELDEVKQDAKDANQHSTAGKMIELKGKALGMYVDKSEVTTEHKGNISINIVTNGAKE